MVFLDRLDSSCPHHLFNTHLSILSSPSAVSHAGRIQSAKEVNMQTEEEQRDWSSDTWRIFAPISAIPWSLVYCTINLATAWLIRSLILYIHKIIKSRIGIAGHILC